ncbi:hypothetical protein GEV29_08490 [Aeromicrobium sp. SMF47]|nr:hypothetical protein [Aeromicrobium yanjiei]MRJ76570.1 hypothetical protein [Aeromicrobium yanjiei]
MRRSVRSERWKSLAVVLALIGLLLLVAFVSGGAEPDFIPAWSPPR